MIKILIFFNSLLMMFNSVFGLSVMPRGLQLNAGKLEQAVADSTQARIEAGTLTGAQAIVKQNNETVLAQTYGLDAAGGSPLSDTAVYRIASMTKPITALALLIEHDRGHLNIYDDLSKYLPEFAEMTVMKTDRDGAPLTDENGHRIPGEKAVNKIRLYQLVSHFSGIGDVDIAAVGENCTIETACAYLAGQPLTFEPGSAQQYSTGAFDVAARVIELTSGMEFSEYLKVNIFDKLGMTDTVFEPTEEQWDRMVAVHNLKDGKAVNEPTVPGCVFGNFPASYHAAGAALASTAADYSKFAQMLLNGGKAEDGTVILSEQSCALMGKPVPDDKRRDDTLWGLGVRVIVKTGANLPVGSFGWSGAYGSHFWIDPVDKVTAVYMKNSAYDGGAGNKSAVEFEKDVMSAFTWRRLK